MLPMTIDHSGENVWHTVGDIQHIKAQLGLPFRSLCGLKLRLDPSGGLPTDDAPRCPECVAKAGR